MLESDPKCYAILVDGKQNVTFVQKNCHERHIMRQSRTGAKVRHTLGAKVRHTFGAKNVFKLHIHCSWLFAQTYHFIRLKTF
uniref:Uncharacterized protein n=1 Tax=Romanomermis culicivorax TaxID=13658 RepID=A0A915L251_ROMCU